MKKLHSLLVGVMMIVVSSFGGVVSLSPMFVLLVDVQAQMMFLKNDDLVIKRYPISTSSRGIGSKSGSQKTPLGWHVISQKIGKNAPFGRIFKARQDTGRNARIPDPHPPDDYVTSRILRLKGIEPGINEGVGIDSFARCIYIHGTPQENLIGKPASHGCIRMKNRDVIRLFEYVKLGTPVLIVRNS